MIFSVKDFIREIYEGKTIGRILFNWQVKERCKDIKGNIIDLACGNNPSYYRFLPAGLKILKTDYINKETTNLVVDLNKKLSFYDNEFDIALVFNAVYIFEDPIATLAEIKRIIKPGGKIILSSPFSNIETPEPKDFRRLTFEGLETSFKSVGFHKIEIHRYGERFSSAVNLIHPFFVFNTLRFFVYLASLILDGMIPKKIRINNPAPLGYFCIIEK